MRRILTYVITHSWVIQMVNALLVFLCLRGAWDIYSGSGMPDLQDGLEETIEGLGVILVSYSVVLQERGTLLEYARLYPGMDSPRQRRLDHVCKSGGLGLVLTGLVMEVSVYLVRMPDVSEGWMPPWLMRLGVGLAILAAGLLTRLMWRILSVPRLRDEAEG